MGDEIYGGTGGGWFESEPGEHVRASGPTDRKYFPVIDSLSFGYEPAGDQLPVPPELFDAYADTTGQSKYTSGK